MRTGDDADAETTTCTGPLSLTVSPTFHLLQLRLGDCGETSFYLLIKEKTGFTAANRFPSNKHHEGQKHVLGEIKVSA